MTRGQCKTGNKKHTQSVKIQKYTRKEWEAKALVGAKGIEDQEAQMGHHASFDESSERHRHKDTCLINQDQLGKVMHCSI